ncbi:MAG TPA: NBR1-Ig-like domain-containing protein [Anaerolineales bacterium]|nr:NBR1-Ig-like domain-containing protein [Anaerolineales bacterium]
MSNFRIYKLLTVVSILTLIISACGASEIPASAISTSVALTVEARIAPESPLTSPSPALTDTPLPLATATASAIATETPATIVDDELCTTSALLVSETHPDGTIILPGTTFTKIWRIQNSGTCTWDTRWQLIFNGGDRLGSSLTYNLPLPAEPGQSVEVPIILKSPDSGGPHTGEWMLKSPWGKTFGIGQYSVPLTTSIVVGSGTPENNKTETVFNVTAVTYEVDRRCSPANTFYTIRAFITTNGPIKVGFWTYQSDGHLEKNFQLVFKEASTKSFEWEWSQKKGSSPNPRWAQIIVTSPVYQEFAPVILPGLCYHE